MTGADAEQQDGAKAIGVEFGSQGFPRRTTWTLPDDSRDTQSCHVFETGATGATGATGFDKVKQDAVETLFPQSRQSRHTESNGVTVGTTGATGCQVCGQTIPKTRIKAVAGEPACVGCGQAERKTA